MGLLVCSNLAVGYEGNFTRGEVGAKNCAQPFDFELNAGEVVALMGANGCGKSTLLKTLSGRIPSLEGYVKLCNLNIGKWNARELAKNVAYISMSGTAADRMTVREFVSLGRMPYAGVLDGRTAEDEKIVDETLALLNLQGFADRLVTELSDGERSRVYLAEAIAQQVKVLLLDEPNAFLDIPHSNALFKLLKRMAAEKEMGIVVSTHSLEYAEKYCHRIMVIDEHCVKVAAAADARNQGLLKWTESDV